MSKILTILLIIFGYHFTSLVPEVSAAEACKSDRVQITYSPNFFPENVGDLTLNFQINNDNTFNILKDKLVRLHFPGAIRTPFGEYNTADTIVTSKNFSLTITDNNHKKSGRYEGVLDWKPANDFNQFCSEIAYQVGTLDQCAIDLSVPTAIPPNSLLTVKFIGKANTSYQLHRSTSNSLPLAITQTDNQGQGKFPSVQITGNIGDRVRLLVYTRALRAEPCDKYIDLRATAAPQPSPPSGPVVIPSPISPRLPGPPTTSGGPETQCGTDADPGIKTAIGCIHTRPAEFVKDFLTFIIGIGGGLAFLMMLLGVFQMLTSAGNPETLSAGKDRLQSAIIGLLFVIFAVLLLQIIGFDILKIPGFGR